jgi:glycerophosphoryl diester phosphodiesterase
VSRPLSSEWFRDAPLVIAHRGASCYAPENTLAAFRLAAGMGAHAIELDAKLTSDGRVVIHHDLTLDRTTDGRGLLSGHSLAELKQLDAGAKFSPRFRGEQIPTLEEVFAAFGLLVLVNVELTNYEQPRDGLPEAVVSLVRVAGLQTKVLLSSFNPLAIRRAHRLAPEIPVALLVEAREAAWKRSLYRWVTPHHAYHPEDVMVSEGLIARERSGSRRVNVWTVNDSRRIRCLLDWGVSGIITDVPDVALGIVAEHAHDG